MILAVVIITIVLYFIYRVPEERQLIMTIEDVYFDSDSKSNIDVNYFLYTDYTLEIHKCVYSDTGKTIIDNTEYKKVNRKQKNAIINAIKEYKAKDSITGMERYTILYNGAIITIPKVVGSGDEAVDTELYRILKDITQ